MRTGDWGEGGNREGRITDERPITDHDSGNFRINLRLFKASLLTHAKEKASEAGGKSSSLGSSRFYPGARPRVKRSIDRMKIGENRGL